MAEIVTTGASSAASSSGASTPVAETTTPASTTPASATETPTASTPVTATPAPPSGEPPPERWNDILDNTRKKTRGEVEAEFRQKYGWADQFQTDPYTFVDSWVDQLAVHPQYQTQMLAKAARLLNSRRGQTPQVAEEPKPDIPITNESGQMVGQTYSADQLKKWREWDWAQKQASFDERIAPLEQQAKTQQQREQLAELQQQSWDGASKTIAELRQNPYFKEHEPKVRAALAAHEEWADNIHAAFNHVLLTEILPTLSQQEQRKVVESLQQKAGASTVGPSGAAAATPKKFKNHAEAMAYYEAHPAEAEAMANR